MTTLGRCILGIGTDIVRLERIQQLVTRTAWTEARFAERILSPQEQVQYRQRFTNTLSTEKLRFLAGR
jgi:holo-[acyl-carrier-protein] synthase